MSRFRSIFTSVAAAALGGVTAIGCGDATDVQVYVVVPTVTMLTPLTALGPCDLAGITHLTLEVSGRERFTVTADGCDWRDPYWGFFTDDAGAGGPLMLDALAPDYHHVVARLWDADGTLRGERARPFDATTGQLELVFERGDLPGWQTVPWSLAVPGCAPGGAWRTARVRFTPPAAARPTLDTTLDCRAASTLTADLPRGPVALDVELRGEAACGHAVGTLDVIGGADRLPGGGLGPVEVVPCAAIGGAP